MTLTEDDIRFYSDDELSSVAMEIVFPLPHCDRYDQPESFDRAAGALAALRIQYADYEPKQLRRAIMHWFDYADRNLRKARTDAASRQRVAALTNKLKGAPHA